jgi:hypothetical protein
MDQRVIISCSKDNSRVNWVEVLRHIVFVAGNLNLCLMYDAICMDMCHTSDTARQVNSDSFYTLDKESAHLPSSPPFAWAGNNTGMKRFTLEEAMKYRSSLSLTCQRRVGGQRRAPAALPPEKRPGTRCTRGWMGPRS